MKSKKGLNLKDSRLVELIERGFDGKRVIELRSTFDRIRKRLGNKGLLLILEVPLLSAQEEIGFLLQLLGNVV